MVISSIVCIAVVYDELFLHNIWLTKGINPHVQPEPMSEILTIANLWHDASRVNPFLTNVRLM